MILRHNKMEREMFKVGHYKNILIGVYHCAMLSLVSSSFLVSSMIFADDSEEKNQEFAPREEIVTREMQTEYFKSPVSFYGEIMAEKSHVCHSSCRKYSSCNTSKSTFGGILTAISNFLTYPVPPIPLRIPGIFGDTAEEEKDDSTVSTPEKTPKSVAKFEVELSGALARAKHFSESILSENRFEQIGRDLKRSKVSINKKVIFTPDNTFDSTESYLKTFNAILKSLPEEYHRENVFLQIELALEASGQLYSGEFVGKAILHALPRLGYSSFQAKNYDDYISSDSHPKFIATNNGKENSTHRNDFSIYYRNNHYVLVFRSLGEYGLLDIAMKDHQTKKHILNKNLAIRVTLEFELPVEDDLGIKTVLTMPAATVKYRLVNRP